MRGHVRARAAAVGALLAVVSAVVLAPTPAQAQPVIEVGNERVRLGESVPVRATGFSPNSTVDLKLCGAPDENGKLACTPGIVGIRVDPMGTINEPLPIEEPPGECPCSVVVDPVVGAPVLARVELAGHPSARQARAPELVVDSATITGGALFGFGGSPELELVLRNAGVSPAKPTIELSWRKGDGDTSPVQDPELPTVGPGETRTVSVPLGIGGLQQGTYSVSGYVVVGDLYSAVDTSRSLLPWGLYGSIVLIIGGVVIHRVRAAALAADGDEYEDDAAPRPSSLLNGPPRVGSAPSRPSSVPLPPAVATQPSPVQPAASAGPVPSGPVIGPPRLNSPAPTLPPIPAQRTESPAPAVARNAHDEQFVGPPRLPSTPLGRLAAAMGGGQQTAQPAAAGQPGAPAAPDELINSYLQATTGQHPVVRPDQQVAPTGSVPTPVAPAASQQTGAVPSSGSYALPTGIEHTGSIPVVPPPPLVLPQQPGAPATPPVPPVPPVQAPQTYSPFGTPPPVQAAAPAVPPIQATPQPPQAYTPPAATQAVQTQSYAPSVPAQPRSGDSRYTPSVLDEPSILQRKAAGLLPDTDTRSNPQINEEFTEEIAIRALASIKERAASQAASQPGPDDLGVPLQRDARAPKGGKRAKR